MKASLEERVAEFNEHIADTKPNLCQHHFILPPGTIVCWGVCKFCGLVKHFPSLRYRCTRCRHATHAIVSVFGDTGWEHLCQSCAAEAEAEE